MGYYGSIAKYGGSLFNVGMGAYFGLETYDEARREGSGTGVAAMKGIAEVAKSMTLGFGAYMGLEALTGLPSATYEFAKWQANYRRQLGREQKQQAFQHTAFHDTQATYTMRQASQAIAQRSRHNTEQAMLGMEAQFTMK